MFSAVDLQKENYWEYGEIAKNLHAGRGYSLFHPSAGNEAAFGAEKGEPFPSAFMPPGYVMFLWLFLFVSDVAARNVLILAVQIAASCITVIGVYVLTDSFAVRPAGTVAASIVALLPEFVYATSTYTPTTFYHLGAIILFVLLSCQTVLRDEITGFTVGGGLAILLLLRSEAIVLVPAALLLLRRRTNTRVAVLAFATLLLMHLPWQIRNYQVFGEWIPLTTSGGLNFFRGNNSIAVGAWADESVSLQAKDLPKGARFEPEHSRLYFNRALQFIGEEPMMALRNVGEKLFHLWMFNPRDERSGNPLYVGPWIILLVVSLIGFRQVAGQVPGMVIAFLICSSLVSMVFFALPRYQTMMKIAVVPIAAAGVAEVIIPHLRRMRAR